MGVVGGACGIRILKKLSPDGHGAFPDGVPLAYQDRTKLEVLLGADVWNLIRNKVVVDFGCGQGREVVELVERGARHVFGIELRQEWLDEAAALARARGVADRCTFLERWTGGPSADVILSIDSFEHFDDPAGILKTMYGMLSPTGSVLATFGPTWYHPYGGHLFSLFPWAHFVFTEHALVTWRATLPGKRPTTSFRETGLNQMTVKRFETLVAASPFEFASFEAVPIRKVLWAANRLLREFTTSIVRCRLVPRDAYTRSQDARRVPA